MQAREAPAPAQLGLQFAMTEEELAAVLSRKTGKEVDLVLTRNSTVMISSRSEGRRISVRLQRIFLEAGDNVISEIASFLKKSGGRTPLMRAFLKKHFRPQRESVRRTILRTEGRHHDLRALFDSVNTEYFHSRIRSGVTWGTRKPGRAVRRILGSYSPVTDTIRINPVLDKANTPVEYIRFILYHEMLHAEIGVAAKGARRSLHSAEFRRREQQFRGYEEIIRWERREGSCGLRRDRS